MDEVADILDKHPRGNSAFMLANVLYDKTIVHGAEEGESVCHKHWLKWIGWSYMMGNNAAGGWKWELTPNAKEAFKIGRD